MFMSVSCFNLVVSTLTSDWLETPLRIQVCPREEIISTKPRLNAVCVFFHHYCAACLKPCLFASVCQNGKDIGDQCIMTITLTFLSH